MFANWIFKKPYQHIFQRDEKCKAADDKISAVDKKQKDFDENLDMMDKSYIYGECNESTLHEFDLLLYEEREKIVKEYFAAKLEAYEVAMNCLKDHMKTLSIKSNEEELKDCTKLEAKFDEKIIKYSIKLMNI